MLKVTLIEDNIRLRETMEEFLRAEGHAVTAFASAEEADGTAALAMAEVLVLDLNLPGESGISFAHRLRRRRPDLGIVMLTARTDPPQRQQGYEAGADIYLTKPSSPGELSAAIRSLVRRLLPSQPAPSAAGPATLRLNPATLMVVGPTSGLRLQVPEIELLRHFAAAPEGRLSLAAIHAAIGGGSTRGAAEVRITRLRKKLMLLGLDTNPIVAVRGFGYQLTQPILIETDAERAGA